MGNYQEVLMKREELREVDEEKKQKPILFGNPFRIEKVPHLDTHPDDFSLVQGLLLQP